METPGVVLIIKLARIQNCILEVIAWDLPSHQIESPVMKRKLSGGANIFMGVMKVRENGNGNGSGNGC